MPGMPLMHTPTNTKGNLDKKYSPLHHADDVIYSISKALKHWNLTLIGLTVLARVQFIYSVGCLRIVHI